MVPAIHTLHRGLIIKLKLIKAAARSKKFNFSPLAPSSSRYDTPLEPLVPFFGAGEARPHHNRIVYSRSSSSRVVLAAPRTNLPVTHQQPSAGVFLVRSDVGLLFSGVWPEPLMSISLSKQPTGTYGEAKRFSHSIQSSHVIRNPLASFPSRS